MVMDEWQIRAISNTSQLDQLVADILDRNRNHPIVVMSTPADAEPNTIPDYSWRHAEELWDSVKSFAEIAILPNGELSYLFESEIPENWAVFGGASRSYPVKLLSVLDTDLAPLRYRGKRGRTVYNILFDAMRHAREAGIFDQQSTDSKRVSGVVSGHIAGRAIVKLDSGVMASVWGELTAPDVPIEWIVARGDRVVGLLDPETNRLTLDLTDSSLDTYLAEHPHGSVTLALVKEVYGDTAVLTLRPGISHHIRTIDVSANPLDSLDILLTEGDVVPVRVIHLSTGGLHLRLSDVDYDEPQVPSPSLVVGGSPWLLEERTLIAAQEDELNAEVEANNSEIDTSEIAVIPPTAHQPEFKDVSDLTAGLGNRPMPGPGMRKVAQQPSASEALQTEPNSPKGALADTQLALQKERAENEELRRRLKEANADDGAIGQLRNKNRSFHERWQQAEAENLKLRRKISELLEQSSKGQQMLREARRLTSQIDDNNFSKRAEFWQNSEEWIRHEIYLAWVTRVSGAEKSQYALPDYVIGENFVESVLQLTEDQFDKAMRTVVDALTDRAKDVPGRDLHTLRVGAGGTEADRLNNFGQRCMRAAVEQKSASARRLHYWQGSGHPIELSRVVAHDDMEP